MRYSIIVPHYNYLVRLKRLVQSIPQRQDLEIIIVDDCSPNSTNDLCSEGLHARASLLRTDTNRGAGAARNLGLSQASGDWILFADSDDIFVSGAFDSFDNSLDDSADIILFSDARC